MKSPANRLKDQSSAIKRAATTLRNTASNRDISEKDRETLKKAALVMDSIGNKTASTAKTKASEEAAFEKAHSNALKQLKDYLKRVELKTTADKVRAAMMTPYLWRNLSYALNKNTLRDIEWYLSSYAKAGIDECAIEHAYHIAKGKYDLKAATDAIDKQISDLKSSYEALNMSKRFVNAIEKLTEAEKTPADLEKKA